MLVLRQRGKLFCVRGRFRRWRNILNSADFVVCPHYGNEDGVFADGGFSTSKSTKPFSLYVQISHFVTLASEFAHGVEYGFVPGFTVMRWLPLDL